MRCGGGKFQCRSVPEMGPHLGAHPRDQSKNCLHELVGLRPHGRVAGLSQLRPDRGSAVGTDAGLRSAGPAASGLGLLVPGCHGRLDGRARADAGADAGEKNRQGHVSRLLGDRGRDDHGRHLYARLSGEWSGHAAGGFSAGQSCNFPFGGTPQHLPLFGQRPRRTALVGVHRVRNAAAVRVTVRADGPTATRAGSEVRHQ